MVPHSWGLLDHKQRRTTVGRTPLDEWSVRRRDLYLTTQKTYNRQTSMPSGGIRTHNPSRRAAVDLRLRPRSHWDRRQRLQCDILMDFILREFKAVDWINLARDKKHWRAVVHTIMQFEFHKRWGTTSVTEKRINFSNKTMFFVVNAFVLLFVTLVCIILH